MFDPIEEAIYELMQGKVVIVCDDEDRENEGDFVAIAEKTTPEVINFMITHGRGLVCVPITKTCKRASILCRWSIIIQIRMVRLLPSVLTIQTQQQAYRK